MRIARRFAGHRAQAEALRGVETRGLEAAVVEGEAFALAVFQEQLAVVRAFQGIVDQRLHARPVHAGRSEEEVAVRHGRISARLDASGNHDGREFRHRPPLSYIRVA